MITTLQISSRSELTRLLKQSETKSELWQWGIQFKGPHTSRVKGRIITLNVTRSEGASSYLSGTSEIQIAVTDFVCPSYFMTIWPESMSQSFTRLSAPPVNSILKRTDYNRTLNSLFEPIVLLSWDLWCVKRVFKGIAYTRGCGLLTQ